MRDALWVALAVAAAYVVLRRERALDDARDVVQVVQDVYYAQTQDSRENEERYRPAIAAAEARYGLPAGLLHRLIYQESRFRSDIINGTVVSPAGALGIAQIIPRFHPGVDPLVPLDAIEYAARYLAELHERFGNWERALAAYNWGPGNLDRHLREHGTLLLAALPAETRDYVIQITRDVAVA